MPLFLYFNNKNNIIKGVLKLGTKVIPNYEFKEMLKLGFVKVKSGKFVNMIRIGKQSKSRGKTHFVDMGDYRRYLQFKYPTKNDGWYDSWMGINIIKK